MSRDCGWLYDWPAWPPYLNSALFVFKFPVSLPNDILAVPVSLVTWISESFVFLICISTVGASVVPTPSFSAETVLAAPTYWAFKSPKNVDVSITWKVLVVVNPATLALWLNVAIPATSRLSSIVVWLFAESIINPPDAVSISLSPVTPIWILSILAPPFASTKPANVVTPATLTLSKLVWPSTSISAFISIFPPKTVPEAKVVTPEIDTLSKFVCPSTSRSAFKSIFPVLVVTPEILTLSTLVWPSTSISAFKSMLPEKVEALTILPVKSPTNDAAVTIPDALTLPTELIPTPSCPASTFPPTWRVKRGSFVAIPTFPPVLNILVYPNPTSISSHWEVGIPCKNLASPKKVTIPAPSAVIIPLFTLTPAPMIWVGSNVVTVRNPILPFVIVAKPAIVTSPRTSRASVGTVVPIPTRPVAVTNRLSSSTCTPLRKLKFFLIFAISYIFSYLLFSSELTLADSSLTASINTGINLS